MKIVVQVLRIIAIIALVVGGIEIVPLLLVFISGLATHYGTSAAPSVASVILIFFIIPILILIFVKTPKASAQTGPSNNGQFIDQKKHIPVMAYILGALAIGFVIFLILLLIGLRGG